MRLALFFLLVAMQCFIADAGEYNSLLKLGDAAPVWKNLPATDGSEHSFVHLEKASAVVVAFTCNSCPYAIDVEDRLIALVDNYAEQNVAIVAINVNKTSSDSLEKMAARAKEKEFNFPYLYDETQQIARNFGATRTPEFFVLDKDRKVVYMGALDDSPNGKNVQTTYVKNAIDSVLAGEIPKTGETVPIGCNIRFQRVRKGSSAR
jgi:peroxiredoxin